ncbi:MAG: hypothetical protein FWF44_11240 [Defluviitaleaceae bacterium]|nr:hypothetical protein [Defluviitaleaceae bacterium]
MRGNVKKIAPILAILCLFALVWRLAGNIAPPAAYPGKYDNSFMQGGKVYLYDGNGGWRDVTPSAVPDGETLETALFLDQNVGWAVSFNPYPTGDAASFTIYRTADGGADWASAGVPADWCGGADMDFIDADRGWLLVHLGVACGSEGVAVMRTTDGGETWETVSVTDFDKNTAGCIGIGGDKNGISFSDANNGWVGGSDASGLIYLWATHDGGYTWQKQDVPAADGMPDAFYITYPPQVYPNGHGILYICDTGTMRTLFYATDDSGETWALFSDNLPVSGRMQTLYRFSPDGKSVRMTDGVSMFTLLGGKWDISAINPLLPDDIGIYKMVFTDEKTGWLIPGGEGADYILKTADGGKTWTEVANTG